MIDHVRAEGMEGREQGHPARRRHEASGATERKRSRAGRLALTALCVLLVGVLAFPRVARGAGTASGSVIWGPGDLPTGKRGVVVAASDKYVAAALALGYSASDISGWSDEVKAKLSNASTGGSFYEFVQSFHDWEDTHEDSGILGPFVEVLGSAFFSIVQSLYGDEIWLSSYDSGLGLNAAFDLALIVQGGDVGGGGSTPLPDDGTRVQLPITLFDATLYSYNSVESGPVYYNGDTGNYAYSLGDTKYYLRQYAGDSRPSASDFSISISKSLHTDIVSNIAATGWDDAAALLLISSISSSHYTITVRVIHKSDLTKYTDNRGNFVAYNYPQGMEYKTLSLNNNWLSFPSTWPSSVSELPSSLIANGTSVRSVSSSNFSGNVSGVMWNTYLTGSVVFDADGVTGGDPVVPPTHWPDEPAAPSPPELPEPSNPTVDPADPWSVTIAPSLTFSVNLETDPVDTTSIVDWLKKIFYQLKLMATDLRQWFENLHTDHSTIIRAINDSCSQLYVKWNEYEDNMMDEFDETRQYLYQLFHWLADQFDFQQDPFNDNNIVYWLKRIWSKLGNGDVNVRPTDPTVDPTGVFDWLNRLIEKLFDGLVGVANQLIDGAGDLLEAVIHQFPFSVPWDIAAYITAFVAAPITPVFDIPIPAVQGWWDAFTIHVDMTPFDSTAATVRAMSKILFAGMLLMKSKELLEMMDVTRW